MITKIFKKYSQISGKLTPISLKKDIPIKTKRIFLIYGNTKYQRGDHAHKKCSQFFFPVQGKIKISYLDKYGFKKKVLSAKLNEGILIKPLTWCKLSFLTKNSIVQVFCDREYEFNDYIENFNDFLNIINCTKWNIYENFKK